jgi:ribosomal protein L11 methylase PrmA
MLARLVLPTGRLVLSGFSVDDTDEVVAAFRNRVVERRSSEEEWAAVTLYTSAT